MSDTATAYIDQICRKAKIAARKSATLDTRIKNKILEDFAVNLGHCKKEIQAANRKDCSFAEKNGAAKSTLDRLLLTDTRIEGMVQSVREIIQLSDPVGEISNMVMRPSGIQVGQMRVPVGVIAVIYESRPNVTADVAALCLKAGNAVILRGGSESIQSNMAIHQAFSKALEKNNVSKDFCLLIEQTDRALINDLLKQKDYIDMVIPRGGRALIDFVSDESRIPVVKHDMGNCHVFVDASADEEMARSIVLNAKTQRPGVCNAVETLLIHEHFPHTVTVLQALHDAGVELRACERIRGLFAAAKPVREKDWGMEYLDLILAVKIVVSLDEAIAHIARYGSNHSEAIVTSSLPNAQEFVKCVDSSSVFVNASTRFADGGEYGLGAEIGISTQKLHARGPMGLRDLTCKKYVVLGRGHIRT